MRPENNKNTKNIHVFRVNRSVKTKEKQQSNTNTSPTTINSRTSLSAETKRLICEDHINNPKYTQEALAKKYGCKRTTVAKIIKSKDRWLAIASDAAIAKRFRQRSSRYPLVENALVLWLEKEQTNLTGITDQMLRFQARQYAQSFSMEGSSGSEDFKASSSWVANFKQRYLTPKLEKLEKLENRSPIVERKSINDAVPESIEIKDQRRGIYRNAVHNFTSVFSVGQPKAHVHTPSPEPTSIASDTNRYNSEEEQGSKNKDPIAESNTSNTSPIVNDQVSVSSNAETEKDDQEEKVKPTKKEDDEDEEMPDQDMMDYTDDFDGPCFHNDTATADVHTQQLSKNNETHSPTTTTPPPQQQNNPKLSAKKHLEAALAFYTSQNESSTSMSANMIKLILQNDFVN